MCTHTYNAHLAPLNPKHLADVINQFPDQQEFGLKLYDVLTKNLTPQVNLFVTFMVFKKMYDQGKSGIFSSFGRILYAPLSVIAQTGEHEWTRFRTPEITDLHNSFLSFMMAKPNREELNVLLADYGLSFSQAHCCGILFGNSEDLKTYEESELFKIRNEMRSYAECIGMPIEATDFHDIPKENSDLGEIEKEFYTRYQEIFSRIRLLEKHEVLDPSKLNIWNKILAQTPVTMELV